MAFFSDFSKLIRILFPGREQFVQILTPDFTSVIFYHFNSYNYLGQKLTGWPDLKWLILFHVVRIPVEIVLFWLFMHKALPRIMTFEGRNMDILAGISAPLVYYFGFVKNKLSVSVILAWNFICLGLLLNIVITAVLSMPFTFQKFGFEQPNIALFYFPYVWLPGCLVPLVLFAHLYSIRQLMAMKAISFKR